MKSFILLLSICCTFSVYGSDILFDSINVVDEHMTLYYQGGKVAAYGNYVPGYALSDSFCSWIHFKGIDYTKDGDWVSHYQEGQIATKGSYSNGLRDGKWQKFYVSGKLQEELFYINGIKDGKYRQFHENGEPALMGQYIKGDLEGKWQSFHTSGNIKGTTIYINGQPEDPGKDLLPMGVLIEENEVEPIQVTR